MNASNHRRLIVLAAFAAIATVVGAFGERANAVDTKSACCTDGKCCGQKSCTGDCCKSGTCTAGCAAKVVKSACCSKEVAPKSACCTDDKCCGDKACSGECCKTGTCTTGCSDKVKKTSWSVSNLICTDFGKFKKWCIQNLCMHHFYDYFDSNQFRVASINHPPARIRWLINPSPISSAVVALRFTTVFTCKPTRFNSLSISFQPNIWILTPGIPRYWASRFP